MKPKTTYATLSALTWAVVMLCVYAYWTTDTEKRNAVLFFTAFGTALACCPRIVEADVPLWKRVFAGPFFAVYAVCAIPFAIGADLTRRKI